MFRRTRKKIVAAIMGILSLLLVGTLCVIYVSSYFEVTATNREMLKEHARQYTLEKPMSGGFEPVRPFPDRGPHANTDQFKLSTFYSVAVSYDGEILEVKNDDAAVYADADLEKIALDVLGEPKESGAASRLIYYKTDKGGYVLVALMDNTILRQSMNTLFRYTLIFAGAALIVFFLLSVWLAKRIVRPLEENDQKQKQFISDAGHELKTPVSVVSANAELLSRELGDNQWLANIQYENERMGKLVSQLLDLARTENTAPQTERVDLSHLVNGEALPFEAVAYEQGLQLNVCIEDGLFINGSSVQLKQLVSILLDNALRHGKGGRAVWLYLSEEHGAAKLSVINSGAEIPEQQRSKLFERFYRMDTARNTEDKHYGLGLSIAKAIAEVHKGKIEVLCHSGFVELCVMLPLLHQK